LGIGNRRGWAVEFAGNRLCGRGFLANLIRDSRITASARGEMRPRERRETGEQDLFRSRLDQIIDINHPLVRLARTVDWRFLEGRISGSKVFLSTVRLPTGLPPRTRSHLASRRYSAGPGKHERAPAALPRGGGTIYRHRSVGGCDAAWFNSPRDGSLSPPPHMKEQRLNWVKALFIPIPACMR
jgi:hypothetical protein